MGGWVGWDVVTFIPCKIEEEDPYVPLSVTYWRAKARASCAAFSLACRSAWSLALASSLVVAIVRGEGGGGGGRRLELWCGRACSLLGLLFVFWVVEGHGCVFQEGGEGGEARVGRVDAVWWWCRGGG